MMMEMATGDPPWPESAVNSAALIYKVPTQILYIQYFDAVGWVAGRASGL